MYSSSNSEVVSAYDSDYIPSDCSFVIDSDACSIDRYVAEHHRYGVWNIEHNKKYINSASS